MSIKKEFEEFNEGVRSQNPGVRRIDREGLPNDL
jgi:hypothetical protein